MTEPGWTVETLKEHYDRVFAQQEKAVEAALAAAEKAVSKAEDAAEKRFESVNEFRQTLSDQTATFLTRKEALAALTAMVAVIGVLVSVLVALR
jgi:hypothetical protein